jgi:hypothetical protein
VFARALVNAERDYMTKTKKRIGRPTRADASARAFAALAAAGIDAATVDPRLILQSIAGDPSAPATARVSACRILLGLGGADAPEDGDIDQLTARALAKMGGRHG